MAIALSGSLILSGSITVSGSIISTGTISMSGSIASASYANNATTASYALNATTGAYANTATSASYAVNATTFNGLASSVFATTGSNTFIGNQVVSGSLTTSGSITATGTITAQTLVVQTITSSTVYSSGSNIFGNALNNTQTFTGSMFITGSNINANVGTACFAGTVCAQSIVIPNSAIIGANYSQNSQFAFTSTTGAQTTANITDAGTGCGVLTILAQGGTAGNGSALILGSDTQGSTSSRGQIALKSLLTDGSGCGVSDLAFSLRNSSTCSNLTERLRITSTGVACFACQVCAPSFIGAALTIATSLTGVGRAVLNSGDATHSGYINWYNSSVSRLGYMGYNNTDIELVLEGTSTFKVTGGVACFACQVCTPAIYPGFAYVCTTTALNTSLTNTAVTIEQRYADMTGGGDYQGGGLLFMQNNSGGATWAGGAITATVGTTACTGGYPGGLAFWVKGASGGTGTSGIAQAMRIDWSGRVGIGTGAPCVLLDVNNAFGSIISATTKTNDACCSEIRAGWVGGSYMRMGYHPTSAVGYIDNTYQITSGQVYGDIQFRQNSGGTMVTRMTLKADGGQLMINTTCAAFGRQLTVASDIVAYYSSQESITMGISAGTGAQSWGIQVCDTGDGSSAMHLNARGGPVGINIGSGNNASYPLHVNGTAYATGAAGSLSDIRHKQCIQPLSKGLAEVMRLNPVEFAWKDEYVNDCGMLGTQLGFIAQEVQEILPTNILTDRLNNNTLALKYNEYIPILTKAIQEQQCTINTLKTCLGII
jgi:hypothetical protein